MAFLCRLSWAWAQHCSNTNHLLMPPREPGGPQLAQHQGRAEALTDPGQELAQHMLGKLPLEMEAALAARTSWKASSSDGNTCRKGKTWSQPHTLLQPSSKPLLPSDLKLGKSEIFFLSSPLRHIKQTKNPIKPTQPTRKGTCSNSHTAVVSKSLQRKKILTYLCHTQRFFPFLQLKELTLLFLPLWAAALTLYLTTATENASAEQISRTQRNCANQPEFSCTSPRRLHPHISQWSLMSYLSTQILLRMAQVLLFMERLFIHHRNTKKKPPKTKET